MSPRQATAVPSDARVLSPVEGPDSDDETNLRPGRLNEFVGQGELKDHLHVAIEAARLRGDPVDHLLFAGPPGLGKTTLAAIIAAEMGSEMKITSGPAIVKPGDIAGLLTTLKSGDVFFIDEIHRIDKKAEEILYTAMEDFSLDITVGQGATARSVRIELPRFTLVGATTRSGMLTGPLRDRFGVVARLDYYTPDELAQVVTRSATVLGVGCDEDGASEIGRRSRGTPRIANRLLRRVRDFAAVKADGVITSQVAIDALTFLSIDEMGLDKLDRQLLRVLCHQFHGGPVGLGTLATAVGEETDTIEDVLEPYLLKLGMLARTPRGRIATDNAWRHLGMVSPQPRSQPSLL